MPKIKKIIHRFGGKAVEFEIWHTSKNNFFIKGGLPIWILEVLGNDIITELYNSPDDLDNAVKRFAEDYNAAVHTSKKIIVYRILFGRDTVNILDLTGTKYNGFTGFGLDGYGFNFNYKICMQHTIDNEKVIKEFVPEFYDSENLIESHFVYKIKGDETVIDWTKERETFFKDLKNSTNNLCLKILEFFGKHDNEKLKAIDSGIKLLN